MNYHNFDSRMRGPVTVPPERLALVRELERKHRESRDSSRRRKRRGGR